GSRGPAALSEAHGGGEPAARRVPAARAHRDQPQPRFLLRSVPGARRAPAPARRLDVGWAAADARHRARADVGTQALAGGRTLGGPRAYPRVAYDHQDQGAEGPVRPHRADGRAELPPGDPHRRPRLHHRARRDRLRGRCEGARAERARAQLLPRHSDVNVREVPIGMYGAVMGLAGLGLSARAAAPVLPGYVRAPAYVTEPWVALGVIAFLILLPLYLAKLVRFPAAVRVEFPYPVYLRLC